ncbi:MAG TPA: M56 family metallopeptidase [Gemmatimonadales bacterium]
MITLEWLADAGLRAGAVVLLAGLFVRTVSRNPAALRHLAWTLALAGALVVPLLARVLPWRLPVVPARSTAVELDGPGQPTPAPGLAEKHKADGGKRESPGYQSSPVQSSSATVSLRTVAPLVWLAGAALLALRLLGGFVLLAGIARRAREPKTGDWLTLLDRACGRIGVRVVPRLLLSDRITMPCTAGWLRPMILLPSDAITWDEGRREVVLLHELAHLKRRDFLPHMLAQATCAVHWFNPLVWIAAHRMRSDAERACDDLVLSVGARPSDYAAHLLEIVRGSPARRSPAPALPMAQRSEFEGRLLAILESTGERRMPSARAALVVTAFIMTAVLPIAAMGAAPAQPSAVAGVDEGGGDPDRSVQAVDRESARLLVGALEDRVPSVRGAAAEALGSLRDTLAIRALMEVLRRDPDAGVRRAAAWALGEIEDARAIPALADALRSDTDQEVRRNAAWAMGSIEDAAAVPALAEALRRERDVAIRKTIIEALGSIEDMSVTAGLTPSLKDADPEIRQAAAEALGSIEDPRSVDELMAAARDDVPEVRRAVIDALGSIEDRRAAPAIARALSDSDVEVRRAAADAMGSLDELRQVPRELIAAINDSDAEVRYKVIQALGSFEDPAAVGPLSALLKDEDVQIRRAVIEALDDIKDPAVTRALREALRDADPEVRRMAAKALGNRSR